jgi:glycosyltransferase involved in cell wall biosynthesis
MCGENMKIFILGFKARADVGSGIPRYTYELVNNLVKTANGNLNVKLMEFGDNPKGSIFRWLKRSFFAVKTANVVADVYHAVTPTLAWPIVLSRKKPIVVTVHDLFILYPDLYYLTSIEYEHLKYVFNKCDFIISTAEYWKKDLMRYFGIAGEKIVVVPVGVDIERFEPLNITKSDDMKLVLYVGGLSREKGLDILLKAFKLVVQELLNVKLLVIGKGSHEAYFKGMAKEMGIASYVEFLGFVPERELPRYYNMADVFVYPSRTAFGLMLLEAMACGTPVIGVKRFQVPEYVGDAAILVEPNNIDQLAKAILRVLTDTNLQRSLREKGLQIARSYSWERAARMTWKVYSLISK